MVSNDRKSPTIRIGQTVLDVQKKENWVASSLFFEESNLKCWEKRNVKLTENCVENTDFAYAATSWPGHMPCQLLAHLSGIRSIGAGVHNSLAGCRMILNSVMTLWYGFIHTSHVHREECNDCNSPWMSCCWDVALKICEGGVWLLLFTALQKKFAFAINPLVFP